MSTLAGVGAVQGETGNVSRNPNYNFQFSVNEELEVEVGGKTKLLRPGFRYSVMDSNVELRHIAEDLIQQGKARRVKECV